MKPYATVEDLEARWRPLSEDEKKKAAALIDDATAFLSSQIDSAAIDDELSAKLKAVCCAIVKRQMMPSPIDGQEMQPLTQFSQTGGPYSFSGTLANPTGDMYITQAEKRLLGIGSCVAFSLMPQIGGDADACR